MLFKVRKMDVEKDVKKFGLWNGLVAPSKISSYHINNGWHLGVDVMITCDREGTMYLVQDTQFFTNHIPLEQWLTSFKHYNCSQEFGFGVSFWGEI